MRVRFIAVLGAGMLALAACSSGGGNDSSTATSGPGDNGSAEVAVQASRGLRIDTTDRDGRREGHHNVR